MGAPCPGVRRTGGAGPEVDEDLVDHRRVGDARDDPQRPATRRTRERVDFEDLVEEGRPPAGGLRRRQLRRGHHREWPVRRGGRSLVPHATAAVGVPLVVPRGDVALVGDVDPHSRQELQRVYGLALQQLGEFDRKTSSWVRTPPEIRTLGGAIFCDRRYNQLFVYHNGAESYYGARGFRGQLRV
jgi:hypothetical protein